MKKILLSAALMLGTTLFVANNAMAQKAPPPPPNIQGGLAFSGKGDMKLQFGATAWGYGRGLTATFDYGIHDFISLGLGAEFYPRPHTDRPDAHIFVFGRGNLHLNPLLNLPESLDIYPGVNVGFYNEGLGLGAHLGVRYFFTPVFGVYGEFGNHGSIGISLNF